MGSRSHVSGMPQRPGLASARSRRAVQEHDAERTNDSRWGVYVRPLGGIRHLVKNHCNDVPYPVTASSPGLTFSPGSEVLLASNGGHPGEIIIGGPALGKRGASVIGPAPTLRVAPFSAPAPEPEEPPLTGDYLAFFASAPSNRKITCSLYDATGAWVADAAPTDFITLGASFTGPSISRRCWAVTDGPALFVMDGSTLRSASFGASSFVTTRASAGVGSNAPVYAEGGDCYWVEAAGVKKSAGADLTTGVTTVHAFTSVPSLDSIFGIGKVGGDLLVLLKDGASAFWLVNATTSAETALGGLYAVSSYNVHQGAAAAGYGITGQDGTFSAGYLGVTDPATLEIVARAWPATFPEVTGFGARDLFLTLSADGTEALVHNQATGDAWHDFTTDEWGFATDPRRQFTPGVHPVLGIAPFLLAIGSL